MAKQLHFNKDGSALKKMQAGVDKLASVVGITLGPKVRLYLAIVKHLTTSLIKHCNHYGHVSGIYPSVVLCSRVHCMTVLTRLARCRAAMLCWRVSMVAPEL